jgi:signal transduction histidine kinase
MKPHRPSIDWSQLWYPGPKRPFSAEEMARAGGDSPSPTLLTVSGVNFATIAFVVLQIAPAQHTARATGALVAMLLMAWLSLRWLWWRPWRKPLAQVQIVSATTLVLLALAARSVWPDRADRELMSAVLAIGTGLLILTQWFLVVWRAGQIEGRLREQAEREKAIEMARRLSAAQLEPHFLFNTLASVQHWVQTKDNRAAPLLSALTGYLRATLPLFNRPLLPAGEELQVVQHHLQIMQLRMGDRLQWTLDVPADLHAVQLPPGVLLTLVENAIQHGLEPQLRGGSLHISGHKDAGRAVFEITDNGPGPPPDMQDGVGLANIRERLRLACGAGAALEISTANSTPHTAPNSVGCRARLSLPWKTA